MYFNYHATVKRLIKEKKLIGWYITNKYNNISPALVLIFNDLYHHTMPIKKEKWYLYEEFLSDDLRV